MSKAATNGEKSTEKKEENLPEIATEEIDQYIQFYEKLMRKKLKVDVAKFRNQQMKRITKNQNAAKSNNKKLELSMKVI